MRGLADQKAKPNAFEALVEKHKGKLSEEDLKAFLTTRLDVVKDLYIWLLGFSIAVAAIIASIGLNLDPSKPVNLVFPALGLGLAIYTIIAVGPSFKEMGRKGPFQYHRTLFDQYLEARGRLREIELKEQKAGRTPVQDASPPSIPPAPQVHQ